MNFNEIANIEFKKCYIVSQSAGRLFEDGDLIHNTSIDTWFVASSGLKRGWLNNSISHLDPQYLYFLVEEPIKVGDWVMLYLSSSGPVKDFVGCKPFKSEVDYEASSHVLKIVASTDFALKLPRPTKNFISIYAKVIESDYTIMYRDDELYISPDSNNIRVDIHEKAPKKETWNRGEVLHLITKALFFSDDYVSRFPDGSVDSINLPKFLDEEKI